MASLNLTALELSLFSRNNCIWDLGTNPTRNTYRRIHHRKWLLSMHVTSKLHVLLVLSLVWQKKRFTQSMFRMIHALCSASNRENKKTLCSSKLTRSRFLHIITSLGVVLSLSTLISKLSPTKIIGSFKLQVSL